MSSSIKANKEKREVEIEVEGVTISIPFVKFRKLWPEFEQVAKEVLIPKKLGNIQTND